MQRNQKLSTFTLTKKHIMLLTKEIQEQWLIDYGKNHTVDEMQAFCDGIDKLAKYIQDKHREGVAAKVVQSEQKWRNK